MFLLHRATLNILFIVLAAILIGWLFSDIVIYLLISLIISSILRPITDYITSIEVFRLKIPRSVAIVFSFALLITLSSLFLLLFAPIISDQINLLSNLDYQSLVEQVQKPIASVETFLIKNFQVNKKPGFLLQDITQNLLTFVEGVNVGAILNYILSFAGTLFLYILAVSFITFFFLYEKGLIRHTLLAAIPNHYFEVVVTTIYKIERRLTSYLVGLLVQVIVIFTIISVGLTIAGVAGRYALLIAAAAALFNLIPYFGPTLGFIFALFVIISTATLNSVYEMTSNEYAWVTLKTFMVFASAQLTDNIFLQPFIFSKSVKAHPLEIFIAIFAGAALSGGLGMIAAIPVYTILRVSFIELRLGYTQYYIFKADAAGYQLKLEPKNERVKHHFEQKDGKAKNGHNGNS